MLPNDLLLGGFKNSNEKTLTLFTHLGIGTRQELAALFISLISLEPFLRGEISGLCGDREW